jgi:hypothetical protein
MNDRLPCHDCKRDVSLMSGISHYCMLTDDVWAQATRSKRARRSRIRYLCLDCTERRIGRSLTEADFTATPWEIAERLANRDVPQLPPAERQAKMHHWRSYTATRNTWEDHDMSNRETVAQMADDIVSPGELMDFAADLALQYLLDEAGDQATAERLFRRMVQDAFADQLETSAYTADLVADAVNGLLADKGIRRTIRVEAAS